MSLPQIDSPHPEVPEFLTWEELQRLPDEIADHIELWDGRVVWCRRGPGEHQLFTARLRDQIERAARKNMSEEPDTCWTVNFETNVFLGANNKSDFLTPDFLIYRCLQAPYQDVHATDTALVGEVLSPSNTSSDMEAKKGRYASAGIPWYWEVALVPGVSSIATVRAYALQTGHWHLPDNVHPMRPANYIQVSEWTRKDVDGIHIDQPFPIRISWSELEF